MMNTITDRDQQLVDEFLLLDEGSPKYFQLLDEIISRPTAEELLVRFDRAVISLGISQTVPPPTEPPRSGPTKNNAEPKSSRRATVVAGGLVLVMSLAIAFLGLLLQPTEDFDAVVAQVRTELDAGNGATAEQLVSSLNGEALTAEQVAVLTALRRQADAMCLLERGKHKEVVSRYDGTSDPELRTLVAFARCQLPMKSLAKLDGFGALQSLKRIPSTNMKNDPKLGSDLVLTEPQHFSLALDELAECLQSHSSNGSANSFVELNRGILLIHYAKYSEAVEVLTPLFESQPQSTPVAVAYAVALFHEGRTVEAVLILKEQLPLAEVSEQEHIRHLLDKMKDDAQTSP